MNFPRTKQIVFANNKWGVWKTTLAYNTGKYLAQKWYKIALIDLDPQCNLSRLALGDQFMQENLFSGDNIYTVLKGLITWWSDINIWVNLTSIEDNFSILQGSLLFSNFENILANSFNEAGTGQERGFFVSSAIQRFLKKKWLNDEIDVFIIDTNPSLSQINKAIFLWADYFMIPMMPDAFNHQWIENLWTFLEKEKRNWNITAKVLADDNDIPSGQVLTWDPLFLWYILNSYNVYSKKPIKTHQHWIDKLPEKVRENLSLKHGKNGLVELSHTHPIGSVQDYWQLPSLAQERQKAIFEFTPQEIKEIWTRENLEKSQQEFEKIWNEIIARISRW